FSRALNDLGEYLMEQFGGSFVALIEAAQGSAEHLVKILSAMPYFRDVATYKGIDVPFYKRAQIMAADLNLAFGRSTRWAFYDIDRLTIFADNVVPHVLRLDGVLSYQEHLLHRIINNQEIAAGSEEEIEIRACALHAVECLVQEFARNGSRI